MDNMDPNAPSINIAPPTVATDTNIGGPGGMNIAEGDYLPIVRVAPVYPARALSRGLEGYVDLSFTVTTAGTVRDPVILFSTSSLFERAAVRAVLKFKYKPRVVDGVPVDVPNVKTRISFQIED
jgi:protein TonB